MDAKPAQQNIQDSFLNTARKEKAPITIYLLSGVKLTGRIRSTEVYAIRWGLPSIDCVAARCTVVRRSGPSPIPGTSTLARSRVDRKRSVLARMPFATGVDK